MKLRAIRASREGAPRQVALFIAEKVPLTVGSEYDVHALVASEGVTLLQIVDDYGYPTWHPSWLFEVVGCDVPADWTCNILEVDYLVLGPEFVAKDLQSYVDMVELTPDQVRRFWERVDSLNGAKNIGDA